MVQLLQLLEWSAGENIAVELVQNVRKSTLQEQFFSEVDRLLHNLVAASAALVDHTRRVVNRYNVPEFRQEYDRRKDTVANADVAAFVKGLRNYMLHYKLPPISHTVHLTQTTFEASTDLFTPELLAWDGWRGGGRKYLLNAGESVNLRKAIEDYAALFEDLYRWLSSQFEDLHSSEVEEVNQLIDEYNRVLTGGVSPARQPNVDQFLQDGNAEH